VRSLNTSRSAATNPSSRKPRIRAVQKKLAAEGVDAFLVTHLPNIFYLCGFTGSNGILSLSQSGATLFTDGRYTVQARDEAHGAASVQITKGSLLAAAAETLRRQRHRRVAFEPAHITVAQQSALDRASGGRIRWTGWHGVIESLRAVKDAHELAIMRAAAQLACDVFQQIIPFVKPGARESDLAAEIEYSMRKKGATGPSFETIIASGPRAALPHARPTSKLLRKNELVVFDLGVILGHYCSDLTRTVHLGRASSRVRRWYRAVLEAQQAARVVVRPGVTAGEVDQAVRKVLRGYRLERRFIHSTGHGLGLEVHETLRLARGEKTPLVPGNVITIEPGVYIEGVGGIRIEDDVVVTETGSEVLTTAGREFLEL
jgi:Xaa-Pro aminopeptidase